MSRLDEIEERLAHEDEPCCDHRNHHFGHCTDCMDTGHAHAPYVDGEAKADLAALVRTVRSWRVRAAAVGLASFVGGAAAQYGLWQWTGGAS